MWEKTIEWSAGDVNDHVDEAGGEVTEREASESWRETTVNKHNLIMATYIHSEMLPSSSLLLLILIALSPGT